MPLAKYADRISELCAVASIEVTALPLDDERSKRLALLMFFLGLIFVMVFALATPRPPISCKRHNGEFSSDFSPDFDISSIDCRTPSIKNSSPTIRFWDAPPYASIAW
jgi:hypothetical protein